MMCEEYNGWKNRETWALNLWLSNDQGLYNMTREAVAERLEDIRRYDPPQWAEGRPEDLRRHYVINAGEAVQVLWHELTDPEGDFAPLSVGVLRMIAEVGSLWRVDWDSIGAAWLDDSE